VATLHVLRVFTGAEGGGGNPLGVFVDGEQVPPERRQAVATELGFSETVFVDDVTTGSLRIFTPAAELPFAGHPLVGTSWLLRENGYQPDILRPPAGDVPTWVDADERTWIRGRAEWAPEMTLRQFDDPADVDALTGAPNDLSFVDAWAWADADAGLVRCRVFASRYGIPEDEATGAAAVRLVTALARPIEIRQGRASIIAARPGPAGSAEIGGACALDEVRSVTVPR
jgi:predicted PhzF superfamily epimerase YddE/YHI9